MLHQDNNTPQADNEPDGLGKKVFVTGGTGFLGAYIIKNLVGKGYSVRALRRSSKLPFFIPQCVWDKVEWVQGDVLDVVSLDEAAQGIDTVIHSAAVVSFHQKDRHLLQKVNVEGTTNVVNAAVENGVRRFIHISSVAALGRKKTAEKVSEDRKWEEHKNNTQYAISKHKAELEVWRGFAEGLSGLIVNPSTILGFGDWHQSSCAIFKNAYREFPWYTKGINGFVGVEDVAELVVQLMESRMEDKRFIINAENVPFRHLFDMIAEHFNKRKPHREATQLMGQIAWRMEGLKSFFSGKKALLTKETARVAHSLTQFENRALLEALPNFRYTPVETVLKEACKKYIGALEKGELAL